MPHTNKHTPTPWKAYLIDDGTARVLTRGRGYGTIATLAGHGAHFQPKPDHHANAAHIVRCVNEHEELRHMLIDAMRLTDKQSILEAYGEQWWKRFIEISAVH